MKKAKHYEHIDPIELDIPAEEIWTYRVDGLRAPAINKEVHNRRIKQAVFIVLVTIAVLISAYFSIRAVKRETFEFTQLDSGCTLTGFSNTGYIKELTLNYKTDIQYDKDIPEPENNFVITEDKTVPLTAIGEFAFNCDNNLTLISIGENVLSIAENSFYSCWSLEYIDVDADNPNYCSIDGVLYNKDKTEVICRPIKHSAYLMRKNGYEKPVEATDEAYREYKNAVLTYTVPETVEKIGALCFNYTDTVVLYLPEGLKTIETMSFIKSYSLAEIYSYGNGGIEAARPSFPDSLEYIGSDAFSYNQALEYVYIPANVTYIGHHAFWECAYKKDGFILGLADFNIAASEEEFNEKCHCGDQWLPEHDHALFKKKIPVNYSAERATDSIS